MAAAWRLAVIVLAGLSFILAHEFGHWIAAESYSLNPTFVWGGASSGLLGLSIGVMHMPATPVQQTVIILGATMLPLILMVMMAGIAHLNRSETAALFAEVWMLLIFVNLVPIPGNGQLDANKIWAVVFPS